MGRSSKYQKHLQNTNISSSISNDTRNRLYGEIVNQIANKIPNAEKAEALREYLKAKPASLHHENWKNLKRVEITQIADIGVSLLKEFEAHQDLSPSTEKKINKLETLRINGEAQLFDYIELDLLYLHNKLSIKHRLLIKIIDDSFPNEKETHFLHGMINFFDGNYKKALKHLAKARRQGFETDLLYNTFGSIYSRQGRISTAQKMFEKSLELNPQYEIALYNMGVMLMIQGQSDQVEKYFLRSAYNKPNYVKPYIGLGQMIDPLEFNESPIHLLRIVLALEPDNPELAQLVFKLRLSEDEFLRIRNMDFTAQDSLKEKIFDIWKPYQAPHSDIEQTFKNRYKLYKDLVHLALEI